MPAAQKTLSPVDGSLYCERALARPDEIKEATKAIGLPDVEAAQAAALVNVLKRQVDG